jgi:iron complex outermembrane receptor protein
MFRITQRSRWLGSIAAMALVAAMASNAAPAQEPDAGTFTLGEVTVTARRFADTPGDTRIDQQEIWRFDTNSLDQVVKLVPGVTATFDGNGRRNERDIFIRGFGRLQVPLSIDGVRIYLPADNRLDFNRFLTPDLAAIQIQKGYVPVSNGWLERVRACGYATRPLLRTSERELSRARRLAPVGRLPAHVD